MITNLSLLRTEEWKDQKDCWRNKNNTHTVPSTLPGTSKLSPKDTFHPFFFVPILPPSPTSDIGLNQSSEKIVSALGKESFLQNILEMEQDPCDGDIPTLQSYDVKTAGPYIRGVGREWTRCLLGFPPSPGSSDSVMSSFFFNFFCCLDLKQVQGYCKFKYKRNLRKIMLLGNQKGLAFFQENFYSATIYCS